MPPLADLVALVALTGLLVTAFRHPSGRVELVVGAAGVLAVALTGLLDDGLFRTTLAHLGPVVLFLATILVVADVCAQAGVFGWAAGRIARLGGGRAVPVFTGTFLVAALITTVLGLDATVVLLTPVVLATSLALGVSARPGAAACLRMANSASLLLPVSNLTNLLALPHLPLDFLGFAGAMAPVLLVVLAVEYIGLRLLHRSELVDPAPHRVPQVVAATPVVPIVVVAVMLAGFLAGSLVGLDPFWISGAAAAVLVAWWRHVGTGSWRRAFGAAHLSFAGFVLALGLVVAAIGRGFLGDAVAGLLPDDDSWPSLLLTAAIATGLAALLTNLSATLLLLPLLAPAGTTPALAALLGLTIGSGLTWTGSLANLLWRRALLRQGMPVGSTEFHRVAVVLTPISLVAAVTVLALTS